MLSRWHGLFGWQLFKVSWHELGSDSNPAHPAMPQFAMFHSDGAGFGIERVRFLNVANARALPDISTHCEW